MTKARSNLTGIYRFTSMGRPIDPAYPSNRALLIILPLLALVSAGLALIGQIEASPLAAAFSGALTAFAAWALTRELAPDYNVDAFVALALAWTLNVAFEARQVLLLFVAMVLVRLVNRSTGLPSRSLDTFGVFGFCTWAAFTTQQPLILLVASSAFALDAILKEPLRRHFFVAAAFLIVFFYLLLGNASILANDLTVADWFVAVTIALGILLVAITAPSPVTYCDTSPDRLDRVRVNTGLVVGILLAFQALLTDGGSAWLDTPIWACFVAVLVSSAIRKTHFFVTSKRSSM